MPPKSPAKPEADDAYADLEKRVSKLEAELRKQNDARKMIRGE